MILNLCELDLALSDPTEYLRLLTQAADLCHAVRWFPDYAAQLLRPIVENPVVTNRLIQSFHDLRNILFTVSECADEFFPLIINLKDLIPRLKITFANFYLLVESFPAYKDVLLQFLLADSNEFSRIINNTDTLDSLKNLFPQHEYLINRRLAQTIPYLGLFNSKKPEPPSPHYPDKHSFKRCEL